MKHIKQLIDGVFDICFPKPEGKQWNADMDDRMWVKVLFLVFIMILVAFFVLMGY